MKSIRGKKLAFRCTKHFAVICSLHDKGFHLFCVRCVFFREAYSAQSKPNRRSLMGLKQGRRPKDVLSEVAFNSKGTLCDSSIDSGTTDRYRHRRSLENKDSQVVVGLLQTTTSDSPNIRRSKREQKENLRAVLGIDENGAIAATETRVEPEGSRIGALTSHYFWGSRFWISIYTIVSLSLLCRRAALLHGISIVILWFVLKVALAWQTFLSQSQEVKAIIQHIRWICKFALKNAEKAAEGDKLRGFLATQTFIFWAGAGKTFIFSFLRYQSREVRTRMLKETRESLNRQILEKKRSLQTTLGFHDRS